MESSPGRIHIKSVRNGSPEMANTIDDENPEERGTVRESELKKHFEEVIERGGSVDELEAILRSEVTEAAAALQSMHAKNELDRR